MPAYLSLFLILLVALCALLGTVTFLMARMLLRPARMTDGKAAYLLKRLSPGDLGLRFERVAFQVRDEQSKQPLKIAGWWIAHPAGMGKCVVLVHGYGDAKVGAIAWAPMWHALGYHILAIDLRAHGESEGRETTAGYFERHDLNQVIDQLRAARPADTQTLVLFGISLGGAVALAAAQTRDDISAVILDCPFTEYSHAVRAHAGVLNMPAPFLVPTALKLAQRMSDADFDVVRPVDLIPQMKCPVMVISGEDDPFAPPEDRASLQATITHRNDPRSVFWKVSNSQHVQCISSDPESYQERIKHFLTSALITASPT